MGHCGRSPGLLRLRPIVIIAGRAWWRIPAAAISVANGVKVISDGRRIYSTRRRVAYAMLSRAKEHLSESAKVRETCAQM
jgi:hypothetical protein